jgi:hypothetical protein
VANRPANPIVKGTASPPKTAPPTVFLLPPLLFLLAALPPLIASATTRRSSAARARADQRMIATALEAYFVDYGAYPIAVPMRGINGELPPPGAPWPLTMAHPGGPTGALGTTSPSVTLAGLTTPISYITEIPRDLTFENHTYSIGPFELDPYVSHFYDEVILGKEFSTPYPYAYSRVADRYIIIGTGPDRDYDIVPARDFDPSTTRTYLLLETFSYDPTNGATSDGDIWRAY